MADPRLPRVLVVDDDARMRRAVGRFLAEQGCEVVEAGDGVDALDALRQHEFDAVVSDVNMPRLSGFALLEAVVREFPTLGSRFLLMSALPQPDADARGARFLLKPFNLDALWHKVSVILASSPRK